MTGLRSRNSRSLRCASQYEHFNPVLKAY